MVWSWEVRKKVEGKWGKGKERGERKKEKKRKSKI